MCYCHIISYHLLSSPLISSDLGCYYLVLSPTTMPEIRECIMHFKHAKHVLVDKLGLGSNQNHSWVLQDIFADATDVEAGRKKPFKLNPCLTTRHAEGHVDILNTSCTLKRGQKDNQSRIWPGTDKNPRSLDGLILQGISYTPRSLILQFGELDLQVSIFAPAIIDVIF